jgi:hypothetical protein
MNDFDFYKYISTHRFHNDKDYDDIAIFVRRFHDATVIRSACEYIIFSCARQYECFINKISDDKHAADCIDIIQVYAVLNKMINNSGYIIYNACDGTIQWFAADKK